MPLFRYYSVELVSFRGVQNSKMLLGAAVAACRFLRAKIRHFWFPLFRKFLAQKAFNTAWPPLTSEADISRISTTHAA
jgi:hypothetical protein